MGELLLGFVTGPSWVTDSVIYVQMEREREREGGKQDPAALQIQHGLRRRAQGEEGWPFRQSWPLPGWGLRLPPALE